MHIMKSKVMIHIWALCLNVFSPMFLVAVNYHIVRVKWDPGVRRGDRVALCTPIILCPTLPMSAPHPLPLVVFGNPLPNRFISGVTETLPTHPQQTAGQKQQTVSCLNKSGGRFGETAPSSGYGYTACTHAHGFAQGHRLLHTHAMWKNIVVGARVGRHWKITPHS